MPTNGSGRLGKALARAREVAAQLGPETDRLNTLLESVETAIASLELGVTASVTMSQGDDWLQRLAFGKQANVWQLMIETLTDIDPEDVSFIPLRNASRELRLRAVDLLPELIENLVKEASDQVNAVKTQAKKVEEILAELKVGDPDDIPF